MHKTRREELEMREIVDDCLIHCLSFYYLDLTNVCGGEDSFFNVSFFPTLCSRIYDVSHFLEIIHTLPRPTSPLSPPPELISIFELYTEYQRFISCHHCIVYLEEPVVYLLGRSTRNLSVPGLNPDPDTTDSSYPTQVFNVCTQHIGQ